MTVLLPYESLDEAIAVDFDFGATTVTKLGDTGHLIDDPVPGSIIAVQIDAQVPGTIKRTFPKHERGNLPMEVLAAIVSIDGSLRVSVPLTRQKSSLFTGTLSLDLNRISEALRVTVFAVRNAPGSTIGYAGEPGARVAWSPTHEIRVTERKPTGGNFIKVVWEDFSSSSVVDSEFQDTLYYLESGGTLPTLYLNKSVSVALIKLMDTGGHGHPRALPRDVLFKSIAATVWCELLRSALGDLRDEAVNGMPVEIDSLASEWKRDIIRLLAPFLFPNLLPEAAEPEICSKINEDGFYTLLLDRVQLAVQLELKTSDIYSTFAEKVFENA